MAFLAIKECERELDQIERSIDEELPKAIARAAESKARELLGSLKFITDLERIGDLVLWVALRLEIINAVPKETQQKMKAMADVLASMLEDVHEGFVRRNVGLAESVIAKDKQMNRLCRDLFQQYLKRGAASPKQHSVEILLMTQALERAGDHATNLAEELHNLILGHTVRHAPKGTNTVMTNE